MRNVVLGLGVLVGIALAPFTACAQPSISEIDDSLEKMAAVSHDLLDLAGVSQGVDQEVAIELSSIAIGFTEKMQYIRELLYILTLIKNNDDRNRVKSIIDIRIGGIPKGIDLTIPLVTLRISMARSQAIILAGNQLKTELRRLQELLSSVSRE